MMRINITWKDRRIDYLNLRDDIYQNIVPDDEAQKVWIPEIGTYLGNLNLIWYVLFEIILYQLLFI